MEIEAYFGCGMLFIILFIFVINTYYKRLPFLVRYKFEFAIFKVMCKAHTKTIKYDSFIKNN